MVTKVLSKECQTLAYGALSGATAYLWRAFCAISLCYQMEASAAQGQLAAEQRATRDHRDALRAAQQRYNELVAALQSAPHTLTELLTAHADAGWAHIPHSISTSDRLEQAAIPARQPYTLPDQRTNTARSASHSQPASKPKLKPIITHQPHKEAEIREHGSNDVAMQAAGVSKQGGKESTKLKDSAISTPRVLLGPVAARVNVDVSELHTEKQQLTTQLNDKCFEAWTHQKKMQRRIDSLQDKLQVGCNQPCACRVCCMRLDGMPHK